MYQLLPSIIWRGIPPVPRGDNGDASVEGLSRNLHEWRVRVES